MFCAFHQEIWHTQVHLGEKRNILASVMVKRKGLFDIDFFTKNDLINAFQTAYDEDVWNEVIHKTLHFRQILSNFISINWTQCDIYDCKELSKSAICGVNAQWCESSTYGKVFFEFNQSPKYALFTKQKLSFLALRIVQIFVNSNLH